MKHTALCFLIFMSLNVSLAQQIVKDINTDPGSITEVENTVSQRCFTCGDTTQDGVGYETPARLGNKVVFTGLGTSFSQPWISDGTAEGTRIIKVLNVNGAYPSSFTRCEFQLKDAIVNFLPPNHLY